MSFLIVKPESTHLLRKGKYHCTADLLFVPLDLDKQANLFIVSIQQNSWIQTSQIGGQPYNDISPYEVSECSLVKHDVERLFEFRSTVTTACVVRPCFNCTLISLFSKLYFVFRMAALLGLSESAAEESLNSMVVAKSVEAKIDRLDGIVDFRKTMDPNEVKLPLITTKSIKSAFTFVFQSFFAYSLITLSMENKFSL